MSRLSSLRLLESYLEDLESLIEESNRLVTLEVSSDDNDYELRKSLTKIKKFLERNDDGADYDELVEQYNKNLTQIKTLDISDFEYNRNIVSKVTSNKKSVRFNDKLDFSSDENSFKPYKDQVVASASSNDREDLFGNRSGDVEDVESDQQSIDSASNHDLFIQHQQQLVQQDDRLDLLAQSVSRQHGLSVGINEELQEQNILLDDLENQLDRSDKRLSTGQKRLKYFSEKAKENGQWITIFALIIILVLLLIILD